MRYMVIIRMTLYSLFFGYKRILDPIDFPLIEEADRTSLLVLLALSNLNR